MSACTCLPEVRYLNHLAKRTHRWSQFRRSNFGKLFAKWELEAKNATLDIELYSSEGLESAFYHCSENLFYDYYLDFTTDRYKHFSHFL
ncbi:unnamed protein product [Blepharisma stoltei]|uniref:Uncharacterized protein n=1 Tax=Blepharisma stoltei TaxID=1481888 RepID=A0AAU9IIZ0_9CILI|nr:unnamed protein product [Blepharisma stoltei]